MKEAADVQFGSRELVFTGIDQDAFNIATMTYNIPLSAVGPDGMDLNSVGYIMSHAVTSPKPWNRFYFMDVLRRRKIQASHMNYWKQVRTPLALYSPPSYWLKKADLLSARFLAGFLWGNG